MIYNINLIYRIIGKFTESYELRIEIPVILVYYVKLI